MRATSKPRGVKVKQIFGVVTMGGFPILRAVLFVMFCPQFGDIVGFVCSTSVMAQTETANQSTQAVTKDTDSCLIFQNLQINAEAWDKGDFLVRERVVRDSIGRGGELNLDGTTDEELILRRITFDFGQNRFRMLTWGRREILDLAKQAAGMEPRTSYSQIGGFCISGDNSLVTRNFPNKKVVQSSEFHDKVGAHPADLMKLPMVPDYRCVVFGRAGIPNAMEDQKRQVEWFAGGKGLKSTTEQEGGRTVIRFVEACVSDPALQNDSEFVFDTQTNMPVRWVYRIRPSDPYGIHGDGRIWEKRFGWIDMAGVIVPDHYAYSAQSQSISFTPMVQERGDVEKTLEFHWFSLNSDLPPESFHSDCLDDLEKFMALVDPEKSSATQLLPKKEVRSQEH